MNPRLKQIQERVEKATEGPFTQTRDLSTVELSVGESLWLKLESDDYGTKESCDKLMQRFADADFIAHARTDVPYLLAFIESQAKEIEALRKMNMSPRDGFVWNQFRLEADAVAKERGELK